MNTDGILESVGIMEFHEKLQELRKKKGLTQEELATALYVSRTAVSKWESGRGYPNIDSLKAIAKFFSVTIDELLSGEELLDVAREDVRQKQMHIQDAVFGLLDLSMALYLFLPLFGQKTHGMVQSVSLLTLTEKSLWLMAAYFVIVIGTAAVGILTLALQNCQKTVWIRSKHKLSLLCGGIGTLLFMITLQPYAAVLSFLFLAIKALILIKRR